MHGELYLADNDGILLDKYNPRYGRLDVPVFRGILGKDFKTYRQYQEENSARIRHAVDMLSEIESGSPAYTRRISEIDISDRNNLKIFLVDDTAEIWLGGEDYLKRFQAFMDEFGYYEKLKKKNIAITEVDLRFEYQIIYR